MTRLGRLMECATQGFPLWVLAASGAASLWPAAFTWFSGAWITGGLGAIMLGMGLTLRFEDFTRVFKYPGWVLCGLSLQFSIMPLFGWLLGHVFFLPDALAVGLVLVACCPGGTASNVIAYLAKADVALSVTMTAVSTMAAVAMTPLLTLFLAGSRMDVDAWGLFLGTLKVVLLPVFAGTLLSRYAPRLTRRVVVVSPFLSVLVVAMIVASIIGAGLDKIVEGGLSLLGATLSLHLAGFVLGYVLARWWTGRERVARTVSIEVGMQNSGLGAHLARSNFPAGMGFDVPSALSALTHCLYGSVAAWLWARRTAGGALELSAPRGS